MTISHIQLMIAQALPPNLLEANLSLPSEIALKAFTTDVLSHLPDLAADLLLERRASIHVVLA